MLSPTRILVPTDFSEPSDKALKQALDIAGQYGAKVFLVHVIREEVFLPTDVGIITDEGLWQQVRESQLVETKERMRIQLEKFPHAPEIEVTTSIRYGVPYEKILEEAGEKDVNLIVIASLGRTGIAKYLIGSVARNVLKGSQCPVLLTK